VGLILAIVFYRYRRIPTPEALLASMHQIDFSHLMLARESMFGIQVSMKELRQIRHNAACLVNLVSEKNFPGLQPEEHGYLMCRLLEINVCAVWAMARKHLTFRAYPLFSAKLAAAIYVEMWGLAKTLAYEYRPDLIPALEQLI
jgi:hypothetical protein